MKKLYLKLLRIILAEYDKQLKLDGKEPDGCSLRVFRSLYNCEPKDAEVEQLAEYFNNMADFVFNVRRARIKG